MWHSNHGPRKKRSAGIAHADMGISQKEMSSFDSHFVIKHQPDLIFALLTVRQTYFSTQIWLKNTQSSQREVHIIACFSFDFVYSVRVQFFLMKTKSLTSATTNAQHSWMDKTERISAYYSYSLSALAVVNNGLLLHTVPDPTRKMMPVTSARRKLSQMNCNTWDVNKIKQITLI